jgi:hypothetical protein
LAFELTCHRKFSFLESRGELLVPTGLFYFDFEFVCTLRGRCEKNKFLQIGGTNMSKQGRGRPPKYTGNVLKHIVGLVGKFNGQQARAILNASPRSQLAKKRNLKLVPKPLGICLPTIYKFASAAGKELHRGRPAKIAA